MRIFKGRTYYLLCFLLIGLGFALGYISNSIFEILCAVGAMLFFMIQLRIISLSNKNANDEHRPAGFFLLLPPIAIISGGVFLLASPEFSMGSQSYPSIITSAALFVCLIFRLTLFWNDISLSGRLLRLAITATMAAPLSLGISLILHLTAAEEAAVLSCMTTIIFGALSFLAMANIIMVSYCGYKGTIESIKIISIAVKERRLIFTRVSILKDTFLVAGKGIISVASVSFFMFVNALYSAGMGIARFIALRMRSQEQRRQLKSYRYVGIIISVSSICYVLYSVRLFFGGKTGDYDMHVALVIALYTFVEFGINIKEAIRLHKSKALEAKALRAVSFSSTLICFVLTQTAIMSFAGEGDNSFSNALSGVVFGGLAALVGIYVILDSISTRKKLEQQ